MQIEAGKYYRTRGGQVFGPMERDPSDKNFPWYLGFDYPEICWTEGGRWSLDNSKYPLDLVAEVYVSDTPPAPQVNAIKTARDELVEKAALAMLEGYYANPTLLLSKEGFSEFWDAAEEFVEARKK